MAPVYLVAAENAIREFRFYQFGLTTSNSDAADWVPELAEAVARTVLDVTSHATGQVANGICYC